MGVIGAPIERANGRQEPESRTEPATDPEPRPFSHDSHFSVSAGADEGYRPKVIHQIVVIGANGQIAAVEPPRSSDPPRRPKPMAVPTAAPPEGGTPLRFLWGPEDVVLGPGEARARGRRGAGSVQDHLQFVALHHKVLEGVGDIAIQAFLRFLERAGTAAVRDLSGIAERPRRNLAFRFQYDEHYLHERHAAQLAWKRFLSAVRAQAGQGGPPPDRR